MKIAIDATTRNINNGGVTSYLNGIVEGFNTLPDPPELKLYSTGKPAREQNFIRKKISTFYRELYWQQHKLPSMAASEKMDILFSPSHLIALKAKIPRVVTFHDLYILRNPKAFRKWHAWFSNFLYPMIMESECNVVTISHFTAQEFYHFFPDFKGRLKVIYNAVSDEWQRINDIDVINSVLLKYYLPADYMIAVGSVEPRKNLSKLFSVLDRTQKGELPPLVLVSPAGWNNKSELEVINRLLAQMKLYWLQNIPREDLILLYNKALLLVYPSLYEGMGAPPLEAMSCGCPVITSDNSSLTELYNGTALLINPLDEEEIAAALKKVIQSGALRNEMIAKGLELRKKFSFTKVAEETLSFFNEIYD